MRQGPGPRQCQIISSQQKWSRSTLQKSVGLRQILALNIMKTIKLQTCVKPKLFAKSLSGSGFEYHESLSNLCKT